MLNYKTHIFLLFALCALSIQAKAQYERATVARPLKEAAARDYSHLWALDTVNYEYGDNILAFIGNDFQRMYIVFLSVAKDATNPYQYNVTGKSKVKNNICDFKGTLIIDTLLYDKTDDCDDIVEIGSLTGRYKLNENSEQPHTGVFEGRFSTNFEWASRHYWESCGDGASNNMFTGKWTSYTSGKHKKCSWGDDRIPGDFPDMGAAEFSPDETLAPSWKGYREKAEKYWSKLYDLFEKYYPHQDQNGSHKWGVVKKAMMRYEKPWWY